MAEKHAVQSATDRVRMTYDDLVALPDDGLRHELIDGEHFVTPSPVSRHQIILANVYRLIGPHTHATKCGVTLFAPADIVFTQYDVVEPDLIYFSKRRYTERKNAQGPPNLAVEILSPVPRRRDEVLKRRLYERMKVDEYWIVDPKAESIKVHRLVDKTYEHSERALEDGAVLTSRLLPGLGIRLAAVFEMP